MPDQTTTIRRNRIVEGSCWSCRRKRIKCDLRKPVCARCQTAPNGPECNYGGAPPIKWVGGAALRGRFASPSKSEECVARLSPQPPSSMDTESLVLYFYKEVLPRFQLMEESLPLDLNMIMQESLLQQAILAVSQSHFDMYSHATSTTSLLGRQQARHKAIQGLRQRLETGAVGDRTELFASISLLCMLDGMIQPCEEPTASMSHLKGGYAVLQSNAYTTMLTASSLQAHLLSVFATMDLVHALLSGDRPYFEPVIWSMFADIQAWFGRLSAENRFLTLLKTFSEMAYLGHLSAHLPLNEGVLLVEKCIPSIECIFSAQSPKPITEAEERTSSTNWNTFCSLYEITGLIYIDRALRLRPIDDEAVQMAVRQGVGKLLDEALPGMMAHCVIFPLLVIGAHCIHTEDRGAIIKALSPSISYLSFGNLALMQGSLKEIWSKSDVQATWWQTFEPVAERVFLF